MTRNMTNLFPNIERLDNSNNIVVLVGSSGSGKTTLMKYISEFLGVPHLVTTTTRPMRYGEVDGIDYYFVSEQEFQDKEQNNELFEKTFYSGNSYGLEYRELEKHSRNISCVITDINGARSLADKYPERVLIFWIENKPIDMAIRLSKRGDSFMNIAKRLKKAFRDKEFDNPYHKFTDVSFTTLPKENETVDNFGLVYYKLLTIEVDKNNTYLNKLEGK